MVKSLQYSILLGLTAYNLINGRGTLTVGFSKYINLGRSRMKYLFWNFCCKRIRKHIGVICVMCHRLTSLLAGVLCKYPAFMKSLEIMPLS